MATAASRWCASPPVVSVEVVQPRDLVSSVSAGCVVRAARVVRVTAGVSGLVDRVGVVEGQRVDAGDVLVRIDGVRAAAAGRVQAAAVTIAGAEAERARLDVEAAQARLSLTRDAAVRRAALWRSRQVSRADYRAAVAEAEVAQGVLRERQAAAVAAVSRLRAAEAEADRAQAARRETVVRAPFAGVVSRVRVERGVQVQGPRGQYRGSALLDVEGVELAVEADVLAQDAAVVAAGQRAAIRVHAYPERSFEVRVEAVGLESIGFGVRAIMSPLGDWAGVRPGFSCAAEVTTATRRAAVAVPRLALLSRDDRLGVWRVEDGRVSFAPVSVGVRGDVFVEVLSGLASGDRVVIGPFDVAGTLEPGQRVQPAVRKFNGF